MKRIATSLLLACLLAVGCTSTKHVAAPEQPKKSASAKPSTKDEVPVAVQKLLPPDQLNEKNAIASAQQAYDILQKEKNQLEKSESARRE